MEKRMKMTVDRTMELYDFLRLRMCLTKKQIRQLKFREDGILVDGVRRRISWQVEPGNVVTVMLEDGTKISAQLHLNPTPLEILYEDEDLCVVNKPAGIPTHPGGVHYDDTVANMLMSYFYEKGESLRIRPVGRLDRETSGALMFAKSSAAAGRMAKQREKGIWRKEYLAMSLGLPFADGEGSIELSLAPDPAEPCRMIISPEGKKAKTHYRVVDSFAAQEGTVSVLEVHLETGRMHQIRCHMAATGHPLLGDIAYGGSREMIPRTALHARVLTFRQPFSGEEIRVEAPVPEDMQSILDKCNGGIYSN